MMRRQHLYMYILIDWLVPLSFVADRWPHRIESIFLSFVVLRSVRLFSAPQQQLQQSSCSRSHRHRRATDSAVCSDCRATCDRQLTQSVRLIRTPVPSGPHRETQLSNSFLSERPNLLTRPAPRRTEPTRTYQLLAYFSTVLHIHTQTGRNYTRTFVIRSIDRVSHAFIFIVYRLSFQSNSNPIQSNQLTRYGSATDFAACELPGTYATRTSQLWFIDCTSIC